MCWEPYNQLVLPQYCVAGFRVWSTRSPMINFNIVELHCADRVLRQFGMRQNVPATCNTDRAVHMINRRGKSGVDWAQKHRDYINAWDMRVQNVIGAEPASPFLEYNDPYMVWYRRITRIRVGPLPIPVPTSGYRPGAYIRDALTDQLVRVSALSQDAVDLGHSSDYRQTLQQVHDESYSRLEQLGMSHLVPLPGSTILHYMAQQRASPPSQVPNQFAEASTSHGQQDNAFTDYGDRGDAYVARYIYDGYHMSSDDCHQSAQVQSPAPRDDSPYAQPTYYDQEPTQGEDDAHNEGLSTSGPHQNPPRRPRTRGGRLNRGRFQRDDMPASIPDEAENVPHHDPSHVHQRKSRYGRQIRTPGCGT